MAWSESIIKNLKLFVTFLTIFGKVFRLLPHGVEGERRHHCTHDNSDPVLSIH
jgi:hypothetical protein